MIDALSLAGTLLDFLLEGLLSSSAAIVLVLLLRRPWRAAFGAASVPLLWALVPAAILAVALPSRVVEAPADAPAVAVTFVEQSSSASSAPAAAALDPESLALALWLSGSLVGALYFVRLQRRFRRQLGHLREFAPRIRIAERSDVGPAVLGVLRPLIVLPADFARRYSAEEQALILAHEHSHLQRGDLLANALATTLRSVYWFNPLIHYAANRLRHDHELASDADVVRRYPNSRRRYADTLLNAQLAVPGLPVGCLWQSSHPLKERILMLKQSPIRPAARRFGMVCSIALTLAGASLAWAAQPEQTSERAAASTRAITATHRIKLDIATGTQHSSPELHFALGQPFGLLIDQDGQHWDVQFTVTEAGDGYRLQGKLDNGHGDQLAPEVITDGTGEFAIGVEPDHGLPLRLEAIISTLAIAGVESPAALAETTDSEPSYAAIKPPKYPQSALDAKQSGKLLLRVLVGSDGLPRQVEVESSSNPGVFDASAVAAVKTWTFNPARRQGETVEAWVNVPVCFSLQEDTPTCDAPSGALEGILMNATKMQAEISYGAHGVAPLGSTPPALIEGSSKPPHYPAAALQSKQSGRVELAIEIGADGVPLQVRVEKSEPAGVFDQAAIDAATNWRFTPALDGRGEPIASWVITPVDFKTSEKPD